MIQSNYTNWNKFKNRVKWSSDAHSTVCVSPLKSRSNCSESLKAATRAQVQQVQPREQCHVTRLFTGDASSWPCVSDWAWAKPANMCDWSPNLGFSPLLERGPLTPSTANASITPAGLQSQCPETACGTGVHQKQEGKADAWTSWTGMGGVKESVFQRAPKTRWGAEPRSKHPWSQVSNHLAVGGEGRLSCWGGNSKGVH